MTLDKVVQVIPSATNDTVLTDEDKRLLVEYAQLKLDKHTQYIHPNPFGVGVPCYFIYQPKSVLLTITTEENCKVRHGHKHYVYIQAGQHEITLRLKGFSTKMQYSAVTKIENIHDARLRNRLIRWALERHRLNILVKQFTGCLQTVFSSRHPVMTIGQLYSLWPEVAALISDRFSASSLAPQPTSLPEGYTPARYDAFRAADIVQEANEHILLAIFVQSPALPTDPYYPIVQTQSKIEELL